jgi:hypothetical protein
VPHAIDWQGRCAARDTEFAVDGLTASVDRT